MPPVVFNWPRFWSTTGTPPHLDEEGFLVDPLDDFGKIANSELKTLEALGAAHCLILIGERGTGKTVESERAVNTDLSVERVDLSEFRSGSEIRACIDRMLGTSCHQTLTVFLDGLDECWEVFQNVPIALSRILEEYKDKIRVRILSRPGPWIGLLEKKLGPTLNCQSLYIAPLRRKDVIEGARSSQVVDPEAFLAEVIGKNLSHLAAQPFGLEFLIKRFKRDANLDAGSYELYLDGCRQLVEERNDVRLAMGKTGLLGVEARLLVAGRIATMTSLCGKTGIWTGLRPQESSNDLLLDEIIACPENTISEQEAVREVIERTGIFSAAGTDRFKWSHRAVADFLCAYWLNMSGVGLNQLLDLLTSQEGETRKVFPNLCDVASWVAARNAAFFEFLLQNDPETLLHGDGGAEDLDRREQLLDAIITRLEKGEPILSDGGTLRQYAKLRHPRLAAQLAPFIDTGHPRDVRLHAIQMARAGGARGLASALLEVALNKSEELYVRKTAARAIAEIGGPRDKDALRTLLDLPPKEDPDDALRGIALTALWPERVTLNEVLEQLRFVQRRNLFGDYRCFICWGLLHHLKASDLSVMLHWLRTAAPKILDQFDCERITEEVTRRSLRHLGDRAIRQELAILFLETEHHPGVQGARDEATKEFSANIEGRRSFLCEIIEIVASEAPPDYWLSQIEPFIRSESLDWLADRVRVSTGAFQDIWIQIFNQRANPWLPGEYQIIWDLALEFYAVRDHFSFAIDGITLDSAHAQRLREWHQRELKWEKRRNQPRWKRPLAWAPRLIQAIREGSEEAWHSLARELWRDPETGHPQWPSGSFKQAPGWNDLSENERSTFLAETERRVKGAIPDTRWIYGNSFSDTAYFDYLSLRLTLERDPAAFRQMSRIQRRAWAKVVAAQRMSHGEEDGEAIHQQLVDLCLETIPEEFMAAVVERLHLESCRDGHVFALSQLKGRIKGAIEARLLEEATRSAAPHGVVVSLLDALIADGSDRAIDLCKYVVGSWATPATMRRGRGRCLPRQTGLLPSHQARKWIRSWPRSGVAAVRRRKRRRLAWALAKCLLVRSPGRAWSVIWRIVSSDRTTGTRLFIETAWLALDGKALVDELSSEALADLYAWMVTAFPPKEDPQFDHAHTVSAREQLAHTREGLVRALEARGTPDSAKALESLVLCSGKHCLAALCKDYLSAARRRPVGGAAIEVAAPPTGRAIPA